MSGVFDDREEEPVQERRDTELTLGSGALIAVLGGLVLLCGLCFGLGYTFGHRGSTISPATAPQSSATAQPVESSSIAKPSATEQAEQAAPAEPAASNATPAYSSASVPGEAAPAPPDAAQPAVALNQPQIHPALTPAVETSQPGQPLTGSAVRPAFAPAAQPIAASGASLMVQIAAVSNVEDAEVLSSALRKHGYPVNVRREPADNLIHVRIGPFGTPAEANSWKVKLLNDGYNAIVQQ